MPVRDTNVCVHWIPIHGQGEPLRLIEGMKPKFVKIVDADVQHLSDAYRRSPDSLFVLRSYWLSDDNNNAKEWMKRDPVGKGEHDAQWWFDEFSKMEDQARQRGLPFPEWRQMVFEGINEPPVWSHPTETNDCNVAFCDKATAIQNDPEAKKRHGGHFYMAAFGVSVGWPGNHGGDTPPDWTPFLGMYHAIKRGNHYLHTHEYWCHRGVFGNNNKGKPMWTWYAGRYTQCDWKLPKGRWLITESGVDDGTIQRPMEGWDMGHIKEEDYMWQITKEYEPETYKDERLGGYCLFTTDSKSEWWTFWTEKIHDELIAWAQAHPFIQPLWKKDVVWPDECIKEEWPDKLPPPDPDDPPIIVIPPASDDTIGILVYGLSRTLGIEECLAKAILSTEGGGQAYGPDGRLLIRFESHIFQGRMRDPSRYPLYFRNDPVKPWTKQFMRMPDQSDWTPIHVGGDLQNRQNSEYKAFEFARSLDPNAAKLSLGMGIAQIMGFNHADVGYQNPETMFQAFQASEVNQIAALFAFILETPGLLASARSLNFDDITRKYNGTGDVPVYSPLLRAAYERCKNNG